MRGSDPGRVSSAVVMKEAVLGGRVKGSVYDMAAARTYFQIQLVKTILRMTMRAGIGIRVGEGRRGARHVFDTPSNDFGGAATAAEFGEYSFHAYGEGRKIFSNLDAD